MSLSHPTQSLQGHTWNIVSSFGFCHTKSCGETGGSPQKKGANVWETWHERKIEINKLWLFTTEKRRLRGHLITPFQYLKGGWKEDGDSLFLWAVTWKRGRILGTSYSKGDFDGIQEESCSRWIKMRHGMVSPWTNGLPREVVDSSALDNFRIQLDKVLDHSA